MMIPSQSGLSVTVAPTYLIPGWLLLSAAFYHSVN